MFTSATSSLMLRQTSKHAFLARHMDAISRPIYRILCLLFVIATFEDPFTIAVHAQDVDTVAEMKAWLTQTAHQGTIAPGTVITMQNWQQYKEFMPYGMQQMFAGSFYWKLPADAQMTIAPSALTPVSKYYVQAGEQFGAQTAVVHRPDGSYTVANYTAGPPFPTPTEPDKGYKLLADNWFAYVPHLYVNTPAAPAGECVEDRFNSVNCATISAVYRQTAFNTDPGTPRSEPGAQGVYYTEYTEVLTPEQSRYTASLTIFYTNYDKWQDSYVFVPALRRSLRLATTARCSPFVGTDLLQDDAKAIGFNGGLALFGAKYLGHRQILTLVHEFPRGMSADFSANYLAPIMWPQPAWAHFELADADIIDVRRIPQQAQGYCYGSRIMFLDGSTHYGLWTELYDANFKLWKLIMPSIRTNELPQIGETITDDGRFVMWDVQNDHVTLSSSDFGAGKGAVFNDAASAEYHDFKRYCTPSGLMKIMQ